MRLALFLSCLFISSVGIAHEVNIELLNISSHSNANEGRLNPEDFLGVSAFANETAAITSGTLDLGKLGINFRNRLTYQFIEGSNNDQHSIEWQELSIDKVLHSNWILNLGKTQIPWDMATSFQPLGFFQKELDVMDITDSQSRSSGLPLAALSYLKDDWNISLVYSHDYENNINGFNEGLEQWAAKLSFIQNEWEASVVAQKPQGQPIGFGVNANYTVNNNLVLYGSGFIRQGTRRPQDTRLTRESYQFSADFPFAPTQQNDNTSLARYVIGGNWYVSNIGLTVEYVYDSRGLSNTQWRNYIEHNNIHNTLYRNNELHELGELGLFYDNQVILNTGTRQKYVFTNLNIDFDVSRLNIFSKIDAHHYSAVSGFSYVYQLGEALDVSLNYSLFSGNSSSEFGSLPIKSDIELMFKYLL